MRALLKIESYRPHVPLLLCNLIQGLSDGSNSKKILLQCRRLGLIPGLGRSLGEGNGYSLQYSCLENPMNKGVWRITVHGVTKSQTQLNNQEHIPYSNVTNYPNSVLRIKIIHSFGWCNLRGSVVALRTRTTLPASPFPTPNLSFISWNLLSMLYAVVKTWYPAQQGSAVPGQAEGSSGSQEAQGFGVRHIWVESWLRCYWLWPWTKHSACSSLSVQSLSHVWLFATSWTAACQTFLSITNSRSLLKLMSIESVMLSNHLILCHPLHLLTSIFPSIRVSSNESVLRIRGPEYWSFSFCISPSNEYSGLISFRIHWFDLAVQEERFCNITVPKDQFFGAQLSL